MFSKKIVFVSIVFLFLLFFSTIAIAISPSGQINIFAVIKDSEGKEEGMAADLFLHAIPGNGEVAFVTSNSLVGKDTQTTGNIALVVAQRESTIDGGEKNFIFDIKANAVEVDGPSAGAAMTLLAYSVLAEKPLPNGVAVTGAISPDGSIGDVGGIFAKAVVASEIGIKLFMIPTGLTDLVIEEEGELKSINLLAYASEKWGMKVVEVSTIQEVLEFAYSDIASIEVDTTSAFVGFIPKAIEPKEKLLPMEAISKGYIIRAKNMINEARDELELTELEESWRVDLYGKINSAERDIEISNIFLNQKYFYSAANYSFNSRVLSGAIILLAENPSLLSSDSIVLDSKISSVRKDLDSLRAELNYLPLEGYEWMIGAQQRVSYAENALNEIAKLRLEEFENEEEEGEAMFNAIYDLVSAQAWMEVARDFLEEANKSEEKKVLVFDKEFVLKTKSKLVSINVFINDINLPEDNFDEVNKRIKSAQISFDNNFYFASLYDAAFAEALSKAFMARNKVDTNDLYALIEEEFSKNESNSSLWGNMFSDHSKFFLENAIYNAHIGRTALEESNLNTSFDLIIIVGKLGETKLIVDDYITKNLGNFGDYVAGGAAVDITYIRKDVLSPFILPLAGILIVLIIILISLGVANSPGRADASRAEKLDSLLNRLDKALSKGKVKEAEYFFLKKKYEDEFNYIKNVRSTRSKITLNLDESRAKLSAFEQGVKDLKKHYHAGLIVPEDYERHLSETNNEMKELKENIQKYEEQLRASRRGVSRRQTVAQMPQQVLGKTKPSKLKGTATMENPFEIKGTAEKPGSSLPRRKKIKSKKTKSKKYK
jgi:predicted S18 family serine protease